ncbi:MAG: V4R domain-containing protein [Candidatus Nezhaarchaeales archaeon]
MPESKAIKDLPVVVFSKGSFLGEFWVKSLAKPSVLGKITSVLGEYGILIKNIVAYTSGNEGNAFILVDCTNMTSNVEEIINKLKSMPEVLDVKFFSPDRYGYVYESFGFPITTSSKEEVIIIRLKSFVSMLDGIRAYFGSAGEAFLWYLAREGGSSTAKWFNEELEGLDVASKIKFHLDTLFSVGWGKFELKKFDEIEKVLEIEAKDCLEIRYQKGSFQEARCIFMRGYLTGALSVYLGKEVKVEEIKCEAKGDGSCVFVCHFG